MNKIKVQSLPLYEVIKDISTCLQIPYEENCGEYRVELTENIGRGVIRRINFDGGFGIIIYDCYFEEDHEFHFVVDEVHPLKFLYCLEGTLYHRFQENKINNNINKFQSAIVASESNNGHVLYFKGKTEIKVGSLEVDRNKFQKKMHCELKNLSPELQTLFMDKMALNEFYHDGFYSLQTAQLFEKIESFENNDFVRRIFLEGQAYEMLTQQIIQYHCDICDDGSVSLLRSSELSLIEQASRKIRDNLSEFETIEKLAEEVGLNVNKLQQGFKHMYQTTVNGYLQEKRMELARNLLDNTDYNMSEIAEKVGLSSKSYFSKTFKETYGILPSEFRKIRKMR